MGLGSARPVPAGAEVGVAGLTGLTAAKGPSSERRAAPYRGRVVSLVGRVGG